MDRLIFFYLVLFPFGKLTGILPDLVIFIIFIVSYKDYKANKFLLIAIFSLVFSLSFFNFSQIFVGALYLFRLIIYFSLINIVYKDKKIIFNSLIVVGFFVAVFGYFQYLFFPDLTSLRSLGWDDHYYRLVSSFLDPAFTGIILLLTQILLVVKILKEKNNKLYYLILFVLIAILLTFSRSTYIAFFVSNIILFLKFRQKFILGFILLFILLIPFLPKPAGEGVNLLRTYSINQKIINYDKSFEIINESPVFGIGFNNICLVNNSDYESHACSGLDNSILFILATMGIVGLVIFIDFVIRIIKKTKMDYVGWGLVVSLIAVFIHGMFTNTFFYNFVLGWIFILISITRAKDYK